MSFWTVTFPISCVTATYLYNNRFKNNTAWARSQPDKKLSENNSMGYSLLADLVLVIHAMYVAFIVGGLATILAGKAADWNWVKNFWFRATHLLAIAVVTLLAWLQRICPLTTLEMFFRKKAGQPAYNDAFIAHWLHILLYYEAPLWVFALCYTLFGIGVIWAWIKIPPFYPRMKTSKKTPRHKK